MQETKNGFHYLKKNTGLKLENYFPKMENCTYYFGDAYQLFPW